MVKVGVADVRNGRTDAAFNGMSLRGGTYPADCKMTGYDGTADGDHTKSRICENLHAHNANNGLNITPNSSMATCSERERETVQNSFEGNLC